MPSHDRTVNQPHDFLGCYDILARVSSRSTVQPQPKVKWTFQSLKIQLFRRTWCKWEKELNTVNYNDKTIMCEIFSLMLFLEVAFFA